MSRIVRCQSEEEISLQEKMEQLYKYYGIPYDIFDDKVTKTQIQSDRNMARELILLGKDIPEDLEKRLLEYKESEAKESKTLCKRV
jgi:hypothetical protein